MTELLDLAKRGSDRLDEVFTKAAADANRRDEALETLAFLAGKDRAEQAEMLAWSWLSDYRQGHAPAEALGLARRIWLACPNSGQIRTDTIELFKAAGLPADRADLGPKGLEDWLNATGLIGDKVSPQRALRALDLALAVQPGSLLMERTSHHNPDLLGHGIFEVVKADPAAGAVAIRPLGGMERTVEILRLGDEYALADRDDFRVLARTNPDRLKELLAEDPLDMLISIIRAGGGQIDTDQLKDNLADRVLTASEYTKWWSRARTAARKSPHVRIEGRSPTMLIYDPVGTTLEEETLQTLGKTWEPAARLAVVEGYLKTKSADKVEPAPGFLTEVAARTAKWMSMPSVGLGDALAVHRLAGMGVPVAPEHVAVAIQRLAAPPSGMVVEQILALDTVLWPIALELLPQARPAGTGIPSPDDWHALYLQLLPHAPLEVADLIAAALIDAGQSARLNAEIMAIAESPLESVDGLAWLWVGPARPGELDLPRPRELLDQLLWLAKQAETVAMTDHKFAREIRAKVRGALSARGYARFRDYISTLDAVLAPMLRRLIRRADGLGLTVPEQMLSLLDEVHPPVIEVKAKVDLWKQEDVIYVLASAMAAKEKELDHITNVLMPANSRAISAAAAHGDLSENSEYKFALEERDLLRARVARIQGELSFARIMTLSEVPTDHVSIYSRVELAPVIAGDPITVDIVSPWDSDVAKRRFNYKAPFSLQLLGKEVGAVVRLAFDGGQEADYSIMSIAPAAN